MHHGKGIGPGPPHPVFSERLNLALMSGIFRVPEAGPIAVIGPRAGDDLGALPRDRVQVVSRHYPDHVWFRQAGYDTATRIGGPYSAAIICLPRAKAEARDTIRRARETTTGPIAIDGQKTDGVDSILKEIRKRADTGEALAKAHGKLFTFNGGTFDDWAPSDEVPVEGRFRTAPGVFSADRVDPGSRALAEAILGKLKGYVVELGAGWGYLADTVLKNPDVASLDLVESDFEALEAAKSNIGDARARFRWADARDFRPATPADHVVTNPPFHESRAADPGLGQAFIRSAASMLTPRGTLWLVANRHLPYEATLQDAFKEVRILSQNGSFKLYTASLPRTPRKG